MFKRDQAFSLIELLVVMGIVALLLSIVLPTLAGARRSARNSTCLGNLKQLNVAWFAYTTDHKGLWPINYSDRPWGNLIYSQFGVAWWGEDRIPTPPYSAPPRRPVNLYIAEDEMIQHHLPVLRCPSDNGCVEPVTNTRPWDAVAASSPAPVEFRSHIIYATAGTSYAANEWMYCTPGSSIGFGYVSPTRDPLYFNRTFGPHAVAVSPSRFVLLGDHSSRTIARLTELERVQRNAFGAWWHGYERTNLAFADGSVRQETTNAIVAQKYSFYLNPERQPRPWRPFAFTW